MGRERYGNRIQCMTSAIHNCYFSDQGERLKEVLSIPSFLVKFDLQRTYTKTVFIPLIGKRLKRRALISRE